MTEPKGFSRTWKIVGLAFAAIAFALVCYSPEMGKDAPDYGATLLRIAIIGSVLSFFIWMARTKIALHWKIIVGLALGVGFALLSSYLGWSEFTLDWIAPWGAIFIRILKFIAVPMVLFSIIMGVIGLGDSSKLGRMGIKTLGLYLITTLFAVSLGLIVVNLWKPGTHVDIDSRIDNRIQYELWVEATEGVEVLDGKDYLHNPEYADKVALARESSGQTEIDAALQDKIEKHAKQKDAGPLQFAIDMVPENIFVALGNGKLMLQVIFFAVFFGIVMLFLPKATTEPVTKVINGLNEAFIKMINMAMKGAPFFVFALLAGTVSKIAGDDPAKVIGLFGQLGSYSAAVVVGLMLMIFLVYPLIAAAFARIPYPRFFRGIGAAQTMAFSTSSSVATLPVTIKCVEENLGVSKETTSFVLPIGATVNMDGTSLYQAIAVVFMAQMHMIELDFMQQLTIVFTATLASVGAAAVPSAGLILMMVVLESVGLNPLWIAIIFPVDRILDMCRTVVNVTGDATVSSVIAKSEGQLNLPKE